MKAYVFTTGVVFVLIVAAHILRVFAEGTRLLKEPSFIFTSAFALALCVWAWRLWRRLSRQGGKSERVQS